ncbi:MAG: DUF4421 domain-containing protein [Cytophagaceae bacterium]
MKAYLTQYFFLFICLFLFNPSITKGQSENDSEESEETENRYYISYAEWITSRFYFSQKFTAFRVNDNRQNRMYFYMPNTTLNMGIGATYSWATLNLAYGFPFLNPDRGQGDTRYLDLQAHAYPKKFVVDLFGQFYKGYYLLPEGKAQPDGDFYVRPDIALTKLGANVQYLFNYDKFSFRAAFLQNEWQKKSAGSFLIGFETYAGRARGDSAVIPTDFLDNPLRNYNRVRFFEIGPNLGYAYTLVIKEHFFITAAASTNLMVGYSVQDGEFYREEQWGIVPNIIGRAFAGYNSHRWAINANYVFNQVRLVSEQNFSNSIITGNYRINFIYRFMPGDRLKKRLKRIRLDPDVEEELQPNQ